MKKPLILEQIPDDSLDAVLGLGPEQKTKYFTMLLKDNYPNVEEDTEQYLDLLETYISSFYLEKVFRSNRFFQEKFTPTYTKTGLIRSITADLYFTDDSLLTH